MTFQKYWLGAVYAKNITPQHILKALPAFDDIKELMLAGRDKWQQVGFTQKQIQSLEQINWRDVDEACEWGQHPGHSLLTLDDSHYPSLLREICDPPLALFVKGSVDVLSQPQLAMVGARGMTAYGARNARLFAGGLVKAGLVVTSGLAIGADAASHQAALKAGGKTIAVMGTGMNMIYPERHQALAAEIVASGGALVSEFPLTAGAKPYHFPQRNRIVSGLSLGVLVIEAALKSGSLITARLANEQGREVFAIPGSIHAPMAKGCHHLIKEGATCVESVRDLLNEIATIYKVPAVEFSSLPVMMPTSLSKGEQKIYSHIGGEVVSMDEIILRSGLTASEVSSILLSLELHGHIQAVVGGYVR